MNSEVLHRLGVKIGHHTNKEALTGTTAFVAEKGAFIGIDIRGPSTGTLNTPMYGIKGRADTVNCVMLTGGSTFGLESAFGAMQYLEENGIGFQINASTIPATTGAVIYDLNVGDNKVRPGKREGYLAAQAASYDNLEQGNVGVGTGATVGKWFEGRRMKGGFGMAYTELSQDIIVGAFAVTNSLGDIVNPKTNEFYFESGGYNLSNRNIPDLEHLIGLIDTTPANTTLAVVTTNVALDKRQLMKVAELAHDGMARAVFPVHTMLDGDVIFALSSLNGERREMPSTSSASVIDLIGIGAQDALMKAIKNSILHAESIAKYPAYQK